MLHSLIKFFNPTLDDGLKWAVQASSSCNSWETSWGQHSSNTQQTTRHPGSVVSPCIWCPLWGLVIVSKERDQFVGHVYTMINVCELCQDRLRMFQTVCGFLPAKQNLHCHGKILQQDLPVVGLARWLVDPFATIIQCTVHKVSNGIPQYSQTNNPQCLCCIVCP